MATPNKPSFILVHCSAVSYKAIRNQFSMINAYHRDVDTFNRSTLGIYVGYHVLLTGGASYLCRVDEEYGNHCNNYPHDAKFPDYPDKLTMNFHSLGICIGFHGDIEQPPEPEVQLMKAQILAWMEKWNIAADHVLFHRDFCHTKTCPGTLMTHEWLQDLIAPPVPVIPFPPPDPPEKVDTDHAPTASLLYRLVAWLRALLSPKPILGSSSDMNENLPAWYESTQGPQISLTLKAIAGLLLPVLQQVFQISFGSEIVDNLIDAALIIFFGVLALVGYARSKKSMQSQIANLQSRLGDSDSRIY